MLRIICPKCGKETTPDVINILPKRRYEIKCKICRTDFIVDAEDLGRHKEAESLSDKPSKESK